MAKNIVGYPPHAVYEIQFQASLELKYEKQNFKNFRKYRSKNILGGGISSATTYSIISKWKDSYILLNQDLLFIQRDFK